MNDLCHYEKSYRMGEENNTLLLQSFSKAGEKNLIKRQFLQLIIQIFSLAYIETN